jgi:hypothetical protein
MHDALFADAARPEGAVVLNLLMLEYSIGHELLLWRQYNPLVTMPKAGFDALPAAERREAVMNAALICHRTWYGAPWGKWKLRSWGRQTRKLETGHEVSKFIAYRTNGSHSLPTSNIPKASGVPYHYFGSPETAMLLLLVHPFYGDFGFGTPFDFPLGLARVLYLADAETKGNVWVKNCHDLEDEARAEALERACPEPALAVGKDAVRAAAEKWNREHPESPVPVK